MPYRDTKDALRSLFATASTQGGYFTAKQAAAAGYGKRHVDYHVKAENFERVDHGLFRLPTVPRSEADQFIRLHLWSRDRNDGPQATVSHASALALHQLSDVIPTRIHLTVPPSFRKRTEPNVIIHKATLHTTDVEEHEGYRITTPLRTLLDVASDGRLPKEQLFQAVQDAIDRGLVRRGKLLAAARERADAERLLLAPALKR